MTRLACLVIFVVMQAVQIAPRIVRNSNLPDEKMRSLNVEFGRLKYLVRLMAWNYRQGLLNRQKYVTRRM